MRKEGNPYAGGVVPTPEAPQQEKILTQLEKTLLLLNELTALHAGLMQHSNDYISLEKSGAKRNNLGFDLGRWIVNMEQDKQRGFRLTARQTAIRKDERELANLSYSISSESFRKVSTSKQIGSLHVALTERDKFPDPNSAELMDIYGFGEDPGPAKIKQIQGADISHIDENGAHIKNDEDYSDEDANPTEQVIGHKEIQRRTTEAISRLKEITGLLDQNLLPQQGK